MPPPPPSPFQWSSRHVHPSEIKNHQCIAGLPILLVIYPIFKNIGGTLPTIYYEYIYIDNIRLFFFIWGAYIDTNTTETLS